MQALKHQIINVASVPQRSPFRYPGGKTWLVPYVRAWLKSLPQKPETLVEPFTGGGIISLTAAFENLVIKVRMIEMDDDVAAVWKTLLSPDAGWMAKRILEFDITTDNVRLELAKKRRSTRERAFQTILRNRVFHGGIMAHGSGLIKNGENGKGIRSRWYPETLANRITDMEIVRDKITFTSGDGMKVMKEMGRKANAVFFIDPPYTAAGKRAGTRLYKHNELDHERLFDLAASLKGDFLMTYDNADEVKQMANKRGFDMALVPMKNTHHATMRELLIGRNVEWAKQMLLPTNRQRELF